MKRLNRYKRRMLLIVAAVLAALFGNIAPASAEPQDFVGDQLQTEIKTTQAQCLDVDLGTVGNARTNVHLWHCRAGNDREQGYQLWDQMSIPNRRHEEFKLRNPLTNKCLTYNVQGAPGTPVWAESCDKNGQGWTAIADPPPFSYITSFVAVETQGRCLDVQNPSGPEGAGIDLWYCDGFPNYVTWDVVLY